MMRELPFNVRYIFIDVDLKTECINRIDCSEDEISVSIIDGKNYYLIELTTYKKIKNNYSQFALQFNNNANIKNIKLIIGDKEEYFHEVTDPNSGKKWWVESKEKKKYGKRIFYDSHYHNILGDFYITFEVDSIEHKIKVEIVDNETLTREGVEELFLSFKNEFYKLITQNKKNYASKDLNIENYFKQKYEFMDLALINSFINHASKITENMHRSLVHITVKDRINRISPTLQTFIDYTKNPNRQYYTGRGSQETYNNPVNSYLLYMIKQLTSILELYLENYGFVLKEINYEVTRNNNSEFINQQTYINNKNSTLRQWINRPIPILMYENSAIPIFYSHEILFYFSDIVRVLKRTDKFSLQVELTDNSTERNKKLLLEFRNLELSKLISKGEVYELSGYYSVKIIPVVEDHKKRYKSSKPFLEEIIDYVVEYSFYKLDSINLIQIDVRNYSKDTEDTKRLRDQSEISKNIRENKKFIFKTKFQEHFISHKKELLLNINKLQNLSLNFISKGIKIDSKPTDSMIFLNNINYSSCLYSFVSISKNRSQEFFNDLVREYKTIYPYEIPILYERWCLLKIISILINKFQFIPLKEEWAQLLIDGYKKEFNMDFESYDGLYRIRLYYENKIYYIHRDKKNRHRYKEPDFRIKFLSKPSNVEKFGIDMQSTDLILDAKFYDPVDLPDVIYELAKEKDYIGEYLLEGKMKNWVYIISPASTIVKKPNIYPSWSSTAYYGSVPMYMPMKNNSYIHIHNIRKKLIRGWFASDTYPCHKYGGIQMTSKPNQFGEDNLQRLIGMYLQFNGYENCIVCGSETLKIPKRTQNGEGFLFYEHICKNETCKHFYIHTHCKSCHKNIIFKHINEWTYQTCNPNNPKDIYNIVCPDCGDFFY